MDEPIWNNSMCNKLGRICHGWKKHAGTEKLDFVFHKYKPKDRRATYAIEVSDIRSQKT